jgi:hypothetical protein
MAQMPTTIAKNLGSDARIGHGHDAGCRVNQRHHEPQGVATNRPLDREHLPGKAGLLGRRARLVQTAIAVHQEPARRRERVSPPLRGGPLCRNACSECEADQARRADALDHLIASRGALIVRPVL